MNLPVLDLSSYLWDLSSDKDLCIIPREPFKSVKFVSINLFIDYDWNSFLRQQKNCVFCKFSREKMQSWSIQLDRRCSEASLLPPCIFQQSAFALQPQLAIEQVDKSLSSKDALLKGQPARLNLPNQSNKSQKPAKNWILKAPVIALSFSYITRDIKIFNLSTYLFGAGRTHSQAFISWGLLWCSDKSKEHQHDQTVWLSLLQFRKVVQKKRWD